MNPYYIQAGGTEGQGRREFFAEGFAAWCEARQASGAQLAVAGVKHDRAAYTARQIAKAVGAWPQMGNRADPEGALFAEMLGERLAKFYEQMYATLQKATPPRKRGGAR